MSQAAVAGAERDTSHIPPTVGSTFATKQAPYLRYLKSVEGWREAAAVLANLRGVAESLDALSEKRETQVQKTDRTVIEILDICSDDRKTTRRLNIGARIGTKSLLSKSKALADPQPVNTFLSHFRNCGPDVHTRVVLMQYEDIRSSDSNEEQEIAVLLSCHVLGIELDLRPSEVSILAGVHSQNPALEFLGRHPMRRGYVSLGTPFVASPVGESACIAANIGQRQLGEGNPYVVVLRLDRHMAKGPWVWACQGGIWRPPAASKQAKNKYPQSWSRDDRDATLVFRSCLRQHVESHDLEDRTSTEPDGHWLGALLTMAFALYSGRLDEYAKKWTSDAAAGRYAEMEVSAKESRTLWLAMRQLSAAISASIGQVEAFEKDCEAVLSSHWESELRDLERLLAETRSRADEIKDVLDSQLQLKSIEVSELSINESRGVIAVTVLAFFFVPLSLAASIFGMNVQEVNATGHGIGVFVVTAIVMLATSGIGWLSWRASRNWALVTRAVKEKDARWQQSTRFGKAKLVEEKFEKKIQSPWRRLAAYVGLHSLEKRSVATLD